MWCRPIDGRGGEGDEMRERARGRPAMTEDQRLMAVTLLANAIRKEEHLSARSRRWVGGDVLP